MTPTRLANRLRTFAKEHGGVRIRCVREIEDPFISPFCFNLGLDRIHGIVFYTKEAPAVGIIHELGHAFFDPRVGDMLDEFNWFGWEWAVAHCLGLDEEWRQNNADYGVRDGDFGQHTLEEQNEILEERIDTAESLGYLDHLPKSITRFELALALQTFSND